jgi:hypothetical protein
VIGTDAMLDIDVLLSAEPAVKVATALAWQEHFKPINSQPQRDEWARAFCRHALHYISTTRPN